MKGLSMSDATKTPHRAGDSLPAWVSAGVVGLALGIGGTYVVMQNYVLNKASAATPTAPIPAASPVMGGGGMGMLKRKSVVSLHESHDEASHDTPADEVLNRDEVEQLLTHLDEGEARIVRMHYLEGKSYDEISTTTGMPSNSIGPTLSRAKAKMRRSSVG